jgi:hypothetical protein
MTDTKALLQLRQVTDDILCLDTAGEDLTSSVNRLYSLFAELTGVSRDSTDQQDTGATQLDSGLAISPSQAAGCLLDAFRTTQFLRSTNAALREAQHRFPGTVIEVLYAGCGPYAPLAVPLATQFTPDEVQFTLLDIHQRSLDSAREIFDRLRLNSVVRDFKQCDATTYIQSAEHRPHLLLTETMQAALLKEPHVSIAMNLAPQLREGGIMIPESIVIDACLLDLTYQPEALSGVEANDPISGVSIPGRLTRLHLGRVAELTLDTCRTFSKSLGSNLSNQICLPAGSVETPSNANENFYLTLLTTITVFGGFTLSEYQSLLTYPIILHSVGKIQAGMKIDFYYQLGSEPGFQCRLG